MTESGFGKLMLITGAASSVITLVIFLLLYSLMREELRQDAIENDRLNSVMKYLELTKDDHERIFCLLEEKEEC